MFNVPWTKEDYPDSLKNLKPTVRNKAIAIMNALQREENYNEQRIIAIATKKAEEWYQNDHPNASVYEK